MTKNHSFFFWRQCQTYLAVGILNNLVIVSEHLAICAFASQRALPRVKWRARLLYDGLGMRKLWTPLLWYVPYSKGTTTAVLKTRGLHCGFLDERHASSLQTYCSGWFCCVWHLTSRTRALLLLQSRECERKRTGRFGLLDPNLLGKKVNLRVSDNGYGAHYLYYWKQIGAPSFSYITLSIQWIVS